MQGLIQLPTPLPVTRITIKYVTCADTNEVIENLSRAYLNHDTHISNLGSIESVIIDEHKVTRFVPERCVAK